MKILPINPNNNFYQTRANKKFPNFTGVSEISPRKLVEKGSFAGDQGNYSVYKVTITYHPFSDETPTETAVNMNNLERPSEEYCPQSYFLPGICVAPPDTELTDYKVVLGERLNCTTREADLVIQDYLRNAGK